MTMTGLILFSFLRADTPLYYIFFCLIFIGAGFGLFSSSNTNAVISSVERELKAKDAALKISPSTGHGTPGFDEKAAILFVGLKEAKDKFNIK